MKHDPFPRALTVEFASDLPRPRLRVNPSITENGADNGELFEDQQDAHY